MSEELKVVVTGPFAERAGTDGYLTARFLRRIKREAANGSARGGVGERNT